MRNRFTCRPSGVRCPSCVWSCSRCRIGSRPGQPPRPRERGPRPELRLVVLALQDRLAYGPTFESAMAALFGGGVSSLTAAAVPAEPVRGAPASAASPQSAGDLNALVREAAKDLADYQRLTAEGKLGEAGQKLEELKRALDKLNTR